MKFRVLRPFINIDGSFLRVNDSVDCSPERAVILRKNSMIGGLIECAMKAPPIPITMTTESAIDKKPKRRRRKKQS